MTFSSWGHSRVLRLRRWMPQRHHNVFPWGPVGHTSPYTHFRHSCAHSGVDVVSAAWNRNPIGHTQVAGVKLITGGDRTPNGTLHGWVLQAGHYISAKGKRHSAGEHGCLWDGTLLSDLMSHLIVWIKRQIHLISAQDGFMPPYMCRDCHTAFSTLQTPAPGNKREISKCIE